MDKSAEYRNIVKSAMCEYERLYNLPPQSDTETLGIYDDERGRYMLLEWGWQDEERVQRIVLYVRLIDGKFWIEEDWTEEGIATDLLAAGVPNTDIVLGFQPPDMRPYTEFAAA